MKVLKIVAEGLTTSFRYPHFMHGVQPTFEVPPPATIYGHICSALGEWVEPAEIEFAYHFTFKARFDDVEHTHIVYSARGKLPRSKVPKSLEGRINPFKRSILFNPKLVLYLNKPEWIKAFCSPCYPVVLGRSQDLFTYCKVSVIELSKSDTAYFEHTLAPYWFALQSGRGYSILLPRFIDYRNNRNPVFARYNVMNSRVHSDELIRYGDNPVSYWVDPETTEIRGAKMGLLFHTFVGEYKDDTYLARLDSEHMG